jgi:radical SAM superfamily enzyme YgiQ (UPF0313 family)
MPSHIIKQLKPFAKFPTGHAIILAGADYPKNSKTVGAHRIATWLRRKDWEIDVLDHFLFMSKDSLKEYLGKAIKDTTKWIGISYTWIHGDAEAHSLIKELKAIYPDLLFIIGGQFPYNVNLDAEWYILGYGELAIDAILEYEFGKGDLPVSEELFTGRYIDAYHNYPATPLSTYAIEYQEDDFLNSKTHLTVEMSRGCKFACKFCSFPFIGMKESTTVQEEDLYRQLNENYQKWGVTCYSIADDTLNDRTEKLITLRNVVNKLDFDPNFSCYVRIDLTKAHPEQVELLAESRAWMHYYGVETLNRQSGQSIGKGMNPETVKELLINMKTYMNKHLGFYRGTAGLIAGLPYETMDSLKETKKWFRENWSDQSYFFLLLQIVKHKDILSAFGTDLAKFGYTEMQDNSKMSKDYLSMRDVNEVMWKSQYTDINECYEFVRQDHEESRLLDAWSVTRYLAMHDLDYEKVLQIKRSFFPLVDLFDYRKNALRWTKEYHKNKIISLDKKI